MVSGVHSATMSIGWRTSKPAATAQTAQSKEDEANAEAQQSPQTHRVRMGGGARGW